MMELLLLEHLNLNVGDPAIAKRFYVEGLRCRLNEKSTNHRQVHVNLGASQFHLPYTNSVHDLTRVRIPQTLDGYVELYTQEKVQDLFDRLKSQGWAKVELRGDHVFVVGPYGNEFYVYHVGNVNRDSLGEHFGGTDLMVGMKSVCLFCPKGSIEGIASFYEDILRADCQVDRIGRSVRVKFGLAQQPLEQTLVFQERDGITATAYDEKEEKRYHVCVYLKDEKAFEESFLAADRRSAIYVNPRFEGGPIEFASSRTLEEAKIAYQFRLKDIVNQDGTKLFFQLEHEVRCPKHQSFPFSNKKTSKL